MISDKEKEIALLIANGLAVKEISAKTNINKRTLEKRIEHLLQRLKCKNRNELVYKLTKAGHI
jgi:DNA-binding NarL/FixJ family response regulator